jgi:hypothetical protein
LEALWIRNLRLLPWAVGRRLGRQAHGLSGAELGFCYVHHDDVVMDLRQAIQIGRSFRLNLYKP